MLWIIFYDDGTKFSNLDGLWTEAPTHGVICVVVRDPTGVWTRWVNSGPAPQRTNDLEGRITREVVTIVARQLRVLDEVFEREAAAPLAQEIAATVLQMNPPTKQGNEYFVKRPDNEEPYPVLNGDLGPFYDLFPTEAEAEPYIKYGRQVGQETWDRIMRAAGNDPDFPAGTSPRRRKTDWQVRGDGSEQRPDHCSNCNQPYPDGFLATRV